MKEKNDAIENLEEKTEAVAENSAAEAEETVDVLNEELSEAGENIKKEAAETAEEVSEAGKNIEEEVTETADEVSETVEESADEVDSDIKNMKKNDAAALLVKKAKVIVDEAEGQLEKCRLLLSDDLKEYEDAKKALKDGGLDECESLLSQLNYVDDSEEMPEEDEVVFEAKEDLEPIRLKDVSSGKFSSFIVALIMGAITFVAMAFFASEKLIDLSKLADTFDIQPIAVFYSKLVGAGENPMVGSILIAAAVLLVMYLVYIIGVSSRASKNLHFAKKQLEEAEVYTAHKGNCKEEMDKVDAHINDAIATLKTYQVLFNEQKGKLQRILHIEGEKEALSEYHQNSLSEMQHTQDLINSVKSFMATTMSEEGKLSEKSTHFLHSAKNKMQESIDRHY